MLRAAARFVPVRIAPVNQIAGIKSRSRSFGFFFFTATGATTTSCVSQRSAALSFQYTVLCLSQWSRYDHASIAEEGKEKRITDTVSPQRHATDAVTQMPFVDLALSLHPQQPHDDELFRMSMNDMMKDMTKR